MYREEQVSFTGPDNPQRVAASSVTASFFEVLRTPPRLGRSFARRGRPAGRRAGRSVLSDGLWTTAGSAAEPGVVGRIVDLDGESVEVVGVMPPGFSFSQQEIDLWRPLRLDRENVQLGAFGINGVARIADGSTLGQVRAELDAMLSNLVEIFPGRGRRADSWRTRDSGRSIDRAREAVVGDIEATLWILLGAVGFLLLIACANVANLFLVRSEARHGEGRDSRRPGREPRTAGRIRPLRESRVRRGGRTSRAAAGAAGGAPAGPLRPAGAAAPGRDLDRRGRAAVRTRRVGGGGTAVRSPAGPARQARWRRPAT